MSNLDGIFKSRDIYFANKGPSLVKAMVFPVVMYGCESWTIKKAECKRTGHGKTDWFQIGKGVHQGCMLSSCSFNLYAEYIMRNAGLEEAQAGIKIAGRNINNLR